jgi:uncharacterized membrane protein
LIASFGFYFAQPWWLLAAAVAAPVVWLGMRSLAALGPVRRWTAIVLRAILVAALAALLARPTLTRTSEQLTVIVVADRSDSVPPDGREHAIHFLERSLQDAAPDDRLAWVDIAEAPGIRQLPSRDRRAYRRNESLSGSQTDLARGVQMAMAIASPETATRIVLASDGNETDGNLREAARIAVGNNVPIDVLPIRYRHAREVVFRRLAAPTRARSGQTVTLRFVLQSTAAARGRLQLSLNSRAVDLDPDSAEMTVPVALAAGTNVKTVSLPVGTRGAHDFEAQFIPDSAAEDAMAQNNSASAMTFVAGAGYVMVVDTDAAAGEALAAALRAAEIDAKRRHASAFPDRLTALVDVDAVVLVNTGSEHFSFAQQEMLCRYVKDLGGGLVMVGGPQSFGAGGWIGSPAADVIPLDMDPPQKKQMPQGALVLVIDRSGSMAGEKLAISKRAAIAAATALSRLDFVGVVVFDTQAEWQVPLQPARDKDAIRSRIRGVAVGGGTDMYTGLAEAARALREHRAGVKHVILLTDGMTAGRDCRPLAKSMAGDRITVSTLAVGPDADRRLLFDIARATGGRYYPVPDPARIPQIFVTEAQVVRRALIVEETFSPKFRSRNETVKGFVPPLPQLDGYVLAGPKPGLSQVVLASHLGDPILATSHAGLGRAAAFTSSADSRWAARWMQWGGFGRFWEQTVRWASRSAYSSDCEMFADVDGRRVTLTVEAVDAAGEFLQFDEIAAQRIAPDMSVEALPLVQVGPGRYRGRFRASQAGSHFVTVHYRPAGRDAGGGAAPQSALRVAQCAVVVPYAPEFRDLSDNAAILVEVADMTGGRVLAVGEEPAALFDRQGVKFPRTAMVLTRELILAWLAVFLLDVAVRRVALDFRALARKAAGAVRGLWRPKTGKEERLERLRRRRDELRERLGRRAAGAMASRRYEPPADAGAGGELPMARPKAPARAEARAAEAPPEAQPKRAGPAEESHLQRLLRAKRERQDRSDGGRERDKDKSGGS